MSHYFTRRKKTQSVGESKIKKLTSKARKRLQSIHVLSISAGSAGSCLSSADSGSLGSSSSTEGSMSNTFTIKQETPTQTWRRVLNRSVSQEVVDNDDRVMDDTVPSLANAGGPDEFVIVPPEHNSQENSESET